MVVNFASVPEKIMFLEHFVEDLPLFEKKQRYPEQEEFPIKTFSWFKKGQQKHKQKEVSREVQKPFI